MDNGFKMKVLFYHLGALVVVLASSHLGHGKADDDDLTTSIASGSKKSQDGGNQQLKGTSFSSTDDQIIGRNTNVEESGRLNPGGSTNYGLIPKVSN